MLVARGLSAAPPDAAAVVRDFDLEVEAGEWIALAGPNGAGKSTLLLTLAGLWPVAAGTLELDGRPIGPHAPGGRATIAVVLQDPPGQLLQETVAAEIGFAARNLGCPESEVEERIARWSARFDLRNELDRDPRALSAGRQQVVLLAAALAATPAILMSDEGGAHLDPATRRLVLDVIRTEVQKGLAVVWVTQEDDEQAAADRTITIGSSSVPRTEAGGPAGSGSGQDLDSGSQAGWEGPDPEPPRESGPALLEVTVLPWNGGPGPTIRVNGAQGLRIGGCGVVAIEGRNGVGKSVLLEAIAGVSASPQVEVTWVRSPAAPPILAAQHPEHQIFAEHVGEEVLFAVEARGGDRAAGHAAAALHFEALGLGGAAFMERRTWTLSAAEKRMLQVVAAIITPASLVLMDEPTCGLDPVRRQLLADLVVRRGASGPVLVAGQDRHWHGRVGATRMALGEGN